MTEMKRIFFKKGKKQGRGKSVYKKRRSKVL